MSGDNLNFGAPATITPEMRAMGIGDAPNDANLTQPVDNTPDKDAAFLGELAELFNSSEPEDVARVEAGSRFGEEGLKPDTQTTPHEQTPEGSPPAAKDASGAQFTAKDDPVPGLPPTETANDPLVPPSPGDGGAADSVAANQPTPEGKVDLSLIVDEQEARALVKMADDMKRLTPQQAFQMQQILTGQYQPPQFSPQFAPGTYTPQQPIQTQPQQAYQQPQPQFNQPVGHAVPDILANIDFEDIHPEVAAALKPFAEVFKAQQQQLMNLEQQQFQARQQQWQQEQQQMAQQMNSVADSWREEKEQAELLRREEWIALEREVMGARTVQGFLQAGYSPDQAVQNALNFHFTQHPEYMRRQIDQEIASTRQEQADQQRRQNLSTALSGGGGQQTAQVNGNSQVQQPQPGNGAMTPDQNHRAMVDFISGVLNNGAPG